MPKPHDPTHTSPGSEAEEARDHEHDWQILQERAAKLARRPAKSRNDAESQLEVLTFKTGGERHAFETRFVSRVYPLLPITRLPALPDYVVGIMPAEGEVISVVDLRILLRLPVSDLGEPRAVILLHNQDNAFGVLADEIVGIQCFPEAAIQPEPGKITGAGSILTGVTTDRTGILDASSLLNDKRLIIDQG